MRRIVPLPGANMHRMDTAAHQQRVEAARYALLRRLAFAMRHHMVVHLQPIGMITEVMERRLESPAPDLAQIHDAMGKVRTHARAAVQASVDVVSWLSPEDGQLTGVNAGVEECVAMLRSYLNFRGFALRPEIAPMPQQLSRPALRSCLPAALLVLTDGARSPAEVVIQAREEGRDVGVTVRVRPTEGSAGFAGEQHYRLLAWEDLTAIAAAEGVACVRTAEAVELTFPA
jgi:hypothetical protein